MRPQSNMFPQAQGAKQTPARTPGNPQLRPGVLQGKPAIASQNRQPPVAPPVYRPQNTPKTVQPKMPNVAQTRQPPPVAPPVYRPQPTPHAVQQKAAIGRQPPRAVNTPARPVAPHVHRPQQHQPMQPKLAANVPARKPPVAPPVYRPTPSIQRKCQCGAKCACRGQRNVQPMTGVIQRVDDPCFIPDWANPPYENLLVHERATYNVGPGLHFNNAQKDEIYVENRNTNNPGNNITITVTGSNQVVESDGDNSLLITKRDVTFAIANVDHVVELHRGGCNSCLNAQVLAESANVGAVYGGGKWIYDPKTGKKYTDNPGNRRKFNLNMYP